MAAYFLDTSALAKRYVVETGSAWVSNLSNARAGHVCWLATLTRVERIAALDRRLRMGHLRPEQAQQAAARFLHEQATLFRVLSLDTRIVDQAARLVGDDPLRAYDAVKLAVASRLRDEYQIAGLAPPVFVSSDRTLNQAAATEGFPIEYPAAHP